MHAMILPQRARALQRLLLITLSSLLGLFLIASSQAFAQDGTTFTVTVESKTDEHPHSGEGHPDGFVIDGEQGKELTLTRGTEYTFQMDGVPGHHPFYLATNEVGNGEGAITEGVSGDEQLTFTPTESTPDPIYYNCVNHAYMGYRINIESADGGGTVDSVDIELLAEGLTAPVTLAEPPDDSGRLFIVDQAGFIWVLTSDGTLLDEPFLDLSDQIVDLQSGFDERGLLGLAFHPDYANNGRFFVYYSAPPREHSTTGDVTVSENDTLGTYLTDAEGNSLYLFTDEDGNPVSCTGDCADAWPPFTVEGEVSAGEGVDASLLSTTERDDGSTQVVYNDWPLYYFIQDQNPGDVNGQGITSFGGTWYLVAPSGEQIENGSSGNSNNAVADHFDHTSHISEFQVSDDDENQADPDSEEILLQVDEPQFNHNAGTIAFGPDGYLYITLGDGGGADDVGPGHVEDWYDENEGGNGQDVTDNLLGSILRIDVDSGDPYGIPDSNPFVGEDGHDEIYAYGFRNPYRFSFDMGGENRLFVGDVGQNRWEEVDIVTQGGNYGWNVKEGTECFDTDNPSDPQITDCPDTDPEGDPLIDPVIEYANANQDGGGVGLSVIGGHVYRGSELPGLEGRYVFGDYSASSAPPNGQIFVAEEREDSLWSFDNLSIANTSDGELGRYLLGLGQDRSGEMYVLTSENSGPTGTSGQVFKIVPAGEATDTEPPAASNVTTPLLQPNYPNPFARSTTIQFTLPHAQHVRLAVYDLLGREVTTLTEGTRTAGTHRVSFDATQLPSGIYVYQLTAGETTQTRKMTVTR